FHDRLRWEDQMPEGPHLWRTLGYSRTLWEPGRTAIQWEAAQDYCFPANGGYIVHGGMVTTILDSAMGGACWSVLDHHEAFLTADLRVEFLRAAAPGTLVAEGWVVRRTRRVVFCAAELYDAGGQLLATSRCTQVVLPADGTAGRYSATDRDTGGGTDEE
ncbi:MAG TPA: PaaI family thioesterase, partial [Egibacteraceae bacterium]|nr:PaaI family thioesterase [Egibacteraceae bacterium]